MTRVDGEAVRDVEQRVGDGRQLLPLGQADRRTCEPAVPERGARAAERSGDDEDVSGLGSRAARDALRAAERRHAQQRKLGAGRVAADDRDAGLVQPFVELEHVVDLRLGRHGERDDERLGVRARGGQVAEVDRRRAKAEIAPRDEVEPEVHALDERVLRDDEAVAELRRVVLDPLSQPAPLELGEEAQLTDLREPH